MGKMKYYFVSGAYPSHQVRFLIPFSLTVGLHMFSRELLLKQVLDEVPSLNIADIHIYVIHEISKEEFDLSNEYHS